MAVRSYIRPQGPGRRAAAAGVGRGVCPAQNQGKMGLYRKLLADSNNAVSRIA